MGVCGFGVWWLATRGACASRRLIYPVIPWNSGSGKPLDNAKRV